MPLIGILSQSFLPKFPCKFEVLALLVLWVERCWPIPESQHYCFALLKLKKKNKKTKQNKTKTAYWSKQFTDHASHKLRYGDTGWLKNAIFWDRNKHFGDSDFTFVAIALTLYESTSLIQVHMENTNNNEKYWLLVYNIFNVVLTLSCVRNILK